MKRGRKKGSKNKHQPSAEERLLHALEKYWTFGSYDDVLYAEPGETYDQAWARRDMEDGPDRAPARQTRYRVRQRRIKVAAEGMHAGDIRRLRSGLWNRPEAALPRTETQPACY
jgi:hypothetical protein